MGQEAHKMKKGETVEEQDTQTVAGCAGVLGLHTVNVSGWAVCFNLRGL